MLSIMGRLLSSGLAAMINSGKRFEQNFRDSFNNSETLVERMNDSSGAWQPVIKCPKCETKVFRTSRFQSKSKPDFFVYYKKRLFILELKSHKGVSIPLNAIKDHQIDYLNSRAKYHGVICGLIVNFSDLEETFFIEISVFNEFIKDYSRKSIPVDYFREAGVLIKFYKKVSNYKYDVYGMMNDVIYRDFL